ncbi:MAG: penicillin-binding protein activator [Pseudomonadota bacterium]|nr:penicillin-binding protein activator [Pseudomonadota bacterium]
MPNPTKILIAIALALLLLTTTPTSAKAISSGCELVRPQRHKTQQQNPTAPPKTPTTSDPLPAADKIWTIGVLLPMSGEYATIGQRFHRGLKLALNADPAPNNHKWQLVLLDSAKIPPATAIKQLKDNHATVILGPIQSKLAQPAAKEAIACRLPIILMAPQPRLTRLNENVFQHFLSAANQAREMARFLQQKGEKKVGLIHPDNDFGNDFKKTFANSCRNKKITIVKSSSYNPHETDFSSAIENLQNQTTPATEPQTTIPSYPFSALVIADFYSRLRLLAPQLTFHNLGKCQLYGTRGGNDQRLEKEAGADLEGAIFLDLGLSLPKPPQTAVDYRKRYLKTYREPASIYDAYAYDSITILNQARRLINHTKATTLSEALLNLPPLKLVTGLTTVSPDGRFSKQLYPIVFKNKKRCNLNDTKPAPN